MKMVVILVWLVVFLIVVLGIVFPLVYISSLKEVTLKEQKSKVKLSTEFITEFFDQGRRLVSVSATMDFMKDRAVFGKMEPNLKGVPEGEALVPRQYFQKIIDQYPSFRFFAYLTPDTVRPVYLQPYQYQRDLTLEQYERGYAYREWAKKAIEKYHSWDRNGYLEPYISDAFISQPGNIPAISMTVGVLDNRKEMIGLLYVNMGLDKLSEFITSLSFGETGKIYLVDSAGQLLAHPDVPPGVESTDEKGNLIGTLKDFSSNPMVSRARKGDFHPGIYRYPDTNHVVLSTYETIPSLGWIIVLEQDVSEAFSIVRVYTYVISALVLLSVIITFIIFLYISREMAESTRQHRELVVISETDPLTGLLNRRSMLSRMEQIVSDAEQTGQGFVLAMFDIDDFKIVNDTYGHVFGDLVLREIAARTVSILRVEDLLFRWGGEEFLLIIRNSDLVRGHSVAEKIRKVVCETPISDGKISQFVTVTIGVCRYKNGSIDSMIIEADEALYSGKRSGKNKVVVSDL